MVRQANTPAPEFSARSRQGSEGPARPSITVRLIVLVTVCVMITVFGACWWGFSLETPVGQKVWRGYSEVALRMPRVSDWTTVGKNEVSEVQVQPPVSSDIKPHRLFGFVPYPTLDDVSRWTDDVARIFRKRKGDGSQETPKAPFPAR